MNKSEMNYNWLDNDPPTPMDACPSPEECIKFDFIKMSQLCEIAEQSGLGRSTACNAFGGDKGKFKVVSDRTARAVVHGQGVRKYVLTSAAIEYLIEMGVTRWNC